MEPSLTWLVAPEVYRVNRLDAHSDHITYATGQEAEAGKSSLRQSLDGVWKFRWSRNPASRPGNFWMEDYDDSGFDSITVPGHIETQGYDQIQYINKLYDWDGHADLRPPEIDWQNAPVGSYVTRFDLEAGLLGKPVCISFQGVETALYLWLNGHFVGYSVDSFTPSEFDLTPYIKPKGNRLCAEVHKRSTGSWLEDQDFFSFSGIFRSVYLYARPACDVEDVWFQPKLEQDNVTGRLCLRLRFSGNAPEEVRLTLTHPIDGTLYAGVLPLTRKDEFYVTQELTFPRVRRWEHGQPELYRVLLEIPGGGFIPYKIGFRRMERNGCRLLLNGKKLMLCGVNRHEWNPHSGRCITKADMDAAISVFKENNINAVRTCHYPDQSLWYTLCDENGIYMMDETNLETHGSWQKDGIGVDASWNIPGSLPQWRDAVVDRANSMFQRDKNHVSILFWSCGNESYAGQDILDMANFFRAQDPSRVVHYEGVFWCREFNDCSDVESRMYAPPRQIRAYLENNPQKPFLNCEYMHSMGNSLGGMESYVTLGEEFEGYHGGFIWDYMDQALWQKTPWGEAALGYGGDFGERQTDYAFSGNGLVTADGIPKPCMQEVRYWYSSPDARKRWDEANQRAWMEAKLPEAPQKDAPLIFTNGDGAYGIRGESFEILFSKLQGGPVSLVCQGKEWLWRAPRPALWRAPTENDLGCGFPQRSAVWEAIDQWQQVTGIQVTENTPDAFALCYTFGCHLMPELTVQLSYRVTRQGLLSMDARYRGVPGAPELPLFGIRFETPQPIAKTQWLGLSGETYPDRYKGARFGIHEEVPHIANYLVPQECGGHTDTHWARFQMGDGSLTAAMVDAPFHFSAIPYTPQQLQQAQHVYELPRPCRTTVTFASNMRGVGGIDSWETDVEEAYRISGQQDHRLQLVLHL